MWALRPTPPWLYAVDVGQAPALNPPTSTRTEMLKLNMTPKAWPLSLGVVLAILLAPTALGYRGHAYAGSFDGEAAGPLTRFAQPTGVAVEEATGDVYVLDAGKGRVEWFNATGTRLEGSFNGSATPAHSFASPEALAIDNTCRAREQRTGAALSAAECRALDPSNGDIYVVDTGHEVLDKFTAEGEYIGQITGTCPSPGRCGASETIPFGEIDGVALDASGNVWVASSHDGAEAHAERFSNDREGSRYLEAIATGELGARQRPGFAVDAQDDLYVSYEEPLAREAYVSELAPDGSPLNAHLAAAPFVERGAGASLPGLAADLVEGGAYLDEAAGVARFAPDGERVEQLGAPTLTSPGGIAIDSASATLYAADPGARTVAIFGPEAPGPPTILDAGFESVQSESVNLVGKINARGASTSYRFQYGRCATLAACPAAAFEHETPEAHLGQDFEVRPVAATLSGLAPGTPYHFRLLATNQAGGEPHTVEGAEQTLVTRAVPGPLALPDDRRWELVSPADTHGALISSAGLLQAAAGGDAITYPASAAIEPERDAEASTGALQVLSRRGASGWVSADMAVPHATAGYSAEHGQEYRLSSADLSRAAIQPFGPYAPLSGEATEQTAYLRDNTTGAYQPLVSAADVPTGTRFGGESEGHCSEPAQLACGPKFRGATPDLAHIVLSSPNQLTEHAPAGQDLYEWTAGTLTLIGQAQGEPQLAFHAISADGARVLFDGQSDGRAGLLMRQSATGETVALDAGEAACVSESKCASGGGRYAAASSDLSRVFFTDQLPLTKDSGGDTSRGGLPEEDLYVCETEEPPLSCRLRDLTPLGEGGRHAGVLGVLGVSTDGATVYFAANGILTNEGDGHGEHAVQGSCRSNQVAPAATSCNLYELHYDGSQWEAPRLLAVLSGADQPDWSSSLEHHTARSSPDGRWLAFMSQRSLTGYDNEDATSPTPAARLDQEVYVYGAGPGLRCASCDPTGQRPSGAEYGHTPGSVWPASSWVAASIPGWEPYEHGAALYQPRYLSDGGRLFFDSRDGLAPQDTNGVQDVYQYEPQGYTNTSGEQQCTSASPGYSEAAGGCQSLISSPSSGSDSSFLDASETGGDVFLLTAAELPGEEHGAGSSVYDAHECTAASPCARAPEPAEPPPGCGSQATCRPVPTPLPPVLSIPVGQPFAGSGVLAFTFSSEGQAPAPVTHAPTTAQKLRKALEHCRRLKPRRRRVGCEKAARHKYSPHTTKAAAHR